VTKDEIAKLPTPETDWFFMRGECDAHLCRDLERRLAAAVMALEAMEMETRKGAQWTTEEINECARETLTAIRGDK